MHGNVLLNLIIDTNGNVKNVELKKGDPVLGQAAADAVRQWQYAPFTVNGTPMEVYTQVTVRFP
jgi:TonB family protein